MQGRSNPVAVAAPTADLVASGGSKALYRTDNPVIQLPLPVTSCAIRAADTGFDTGQFDQALCSYSTNVQLRRQLLQYPGLSRDVDKSSGNEYAAAKLTAFKPESSSYSSYHSSIRTT